LLITPTISFITVRNAAAKTELRATAVFSLLARIASLLARSVLDTPLEGLLTRTEIGLAYGSKYTADLLETLFSIAQ
jgi:hypothetical protein